MERLHLGLLSERDKQNLGRPVEVVLGELQAAEPASPSKLAYTQVGEGTDTRHVYTTADNHLTILIQSHSEDTPQVTQIGKGFHYSIEGGSSADITIMGTKDPRHKQGHIVELNGDNFQASHFGEVDVFDARTNTPFNPQGELVSRKMRPNF